MPQLSAVLPVLVGVLVSGLHVHISRSVQRLEEGFATPALGLLRHAAAKVPGTASHYCTLGLGWEAYCLCLPLVVVVYSSLWCVPRGGPIVGGRNTHTHANPPLLLNGASYDLGRSAMRDLVHSTYCCSIYPRRADLIRTGGVWVGA